VSTPETDAAAEILRLLDAEQYQQAIKLSKGMTSTEGSAIVARASVTLYAGEGDLDDAIFALEDLLASETPLSTDDRARAYALVAHSYGIKRAFKSGAKWARAGREAVGTRVELVCAEARLAQWADDRERAAVLAAEARRIAPEATLARVLDADLAYVVGDFEKCHATLAPIPSTSPDWLRGARLRASAYAAVQDYAAERSLREEIAQRGARSDRAGDDRIGYAIALAAAGRRSDALEQLRVVWRSAPDTPVGRYAWDRIEALEAALARPEEAPRRALVFPSTYQKHNYCGPAVLELCLRYLGIEITQDDIAKTVKRETGTPMRAIVTFLADHGVVARRIAATRARLKRAIDIGLPVILQEEYSMTSHVAVLTGYDAGLGLFITSDPATHRPIYKPFAWTEAAGDLFGNGALLVLGRAGEAATEEFARRCDESDLVDQEHLVVLDDCDRRRDQGSFSGGADAVFDEIIRIADRAIALHPNFKLAWHRKWRALEALASVRGTEEAESRALAGLFEIRTRFTGDEWPHQLHASWLMSRNRFDEAFVQYLEASTKDPGDGNNVMGMGYTRALAGDFAAGERHLLRGLRLSPDSASAYIRLADVYVRQLQELDTDLEDAERRRLLTKPNVEVTHPIERSKEELLRRAMHFALLGRELAPNDEFVHELVGILALRTSRNADAVAAFEAATKIAPNRLTSIRGLAFACEASGDRERAERLLSEATARDADATTWLAFADVLARRGKGAEAIAALSKAIRALDSRCELVAPLFALMCEQDSTETAAGKLRELAESCASDGSFQRAVASELDEAGQRGHAIAVYRNALATAPEDTWLAHRLALLLARNLATRDEAIKLFERVIASEPTWVSSRRELALLLYMSDPERALDIITPIAETKDPYEWDLEVQGMVLGKLGRPKEAERARKRALQASEKPAEATLRFCSWHRGYQRYERALELCRTFVDAEGKSKLGASLEEKAQADWLSTMRLAGRMDEALPTVRAILEANGGVVPKHLAFNIYWGARSSEPELAAAAAAVCAEHEDDEEEKLDWKIRESGQRAEAGDSAMLDAMASHLPDTPSIWAELSYAYSINDREAEADVAAEKAYALDSKDREALSAMEDRATHHGRIDQALEFARKLFELHPYEHVGPERLGILLAKMLRAEEAVPFGAQAVDAAPYCHHAQESAALAYFVAGRFDLATAHAKQHLAISGSSDEDSDARMMLCAIERDVAGLERGFAERAKTETTSYFPAFDARLREVAARPLSA